MTYTVSYSTFPKWVTKGGKCWSQIWTWAVYQIKLKCLLGCCCFKSLVGDRSSKGRGPFWPQLESCAYRAVVYFYRALIFLHVYIFSFLCLSLNLISNSANMLHIWNLTDQYEIHKVYHCYLHSTSDLLVFLKKENCLWNVQRYSPWTDIQIDVVSL